MNNITKFLLAASAAVSILFGVSFSAAAQNSISGTVTDSDGNPLIQASVLIEGTTQGTVTDEAGRYSLTAKAGQTLIVSYIGYLDEKAVVNSSQAVYNFVLQEDGNILDDVVVVGYGTQKKVNLTGSVSSVGSATIEDKFLTNSTNALQGAAAGVTVTTQSGAPGDDAGTIRIRGLGTFGTASSAPLVLIDGVQGSLSNVDPSTIDKISILKDAASSAIYGSRAANGVLLVTTKRGKSGHTSINYRGNMGFQTPTDLPELVTAEEFMTLNNETRVNDGGSPYWTQEYIDNYRANHAIDPDSYPITDWQKEILGKALGKSTNHTVSMTASTDKIKVLTSFGYLHQDGIMKNMREYERYNFRNNMDVDLSKKLSMRFDMATTYGDKSYHPNEATLFNHMNTRDPLILARFSTGYLNAFSGTSTNTLVYLTGQGGRYRSQSFNLTGSLGLNYKPAKWLTLDAQYAPRFVLSNAHNFVDLVTLYTDPYGTESSYHGRSYNQLTEATNTTFYNNFTTTADFHKNFGRIHDMSLLVGYSWEDMLNSNLNATRQSLPYPQYNVISGGADDETKDNGGTKYEWALQSFFGRFKYNFKERYLFEANIRVDGSSRFTGSKQYGVFPSVSAAWRVTEEPFMQKYKKSLNELKFRASYGTLGNQSIGSDYYPTVQTLAVSSISANDNIVPIVTLNTLANPAITWESTSMADFGFDIGLFGKLDITADYYHKRTEGILLKLAIAPKIGLDAPYQNAGTVVNDGWELAIAWHDNIGKVRYGIEANLSDVRNRITDMHGMQQLRNSDMVINIGGGTINSIYGYECLGIIQTQEEADYINANCPQFGRKVVPGDLAYRDVGGKPIYQVDANGNYLLDDDGNRIPVYDKYGNPVQEPDGKITADDKTIIGSTIPRYTYGLNFSLGYGNVDFSMQLQGVGKADGLLNTYYVMPNDQGGTYRKEHLDRWTPETPNGKFPRMTAVTTNNNAISSFWMKSAAYCRMKNIQVSYTLPKNLVSKVNIKKARVFVNGSNVFTLTNFYQGYDPEVNCTGTDGITLGAASNYPQVKTFTGGIEISF